MLKVTCALVILVATTALIGLTAPPSTAQQVGQREATPIPSSLGAEEMASGIPMGCDCSPTILKNCRAIGKVCCTTWYPEERRCNSRCASACGD